MDNRNERQTVIITGAYGGIGYDLAEGFLRRGDNVVLSGRDHATLCAAAERLDQPRRIASLPAISAKRRQANAWSLPRSRVSEAWMCW